MVAGLHLATALSTAGNAAVAVLVPWLVLSRTGSAAAAGTVSAVALAAAVPALLLAGPLLDRVDRRRLSVGADLASAGAVALLPVVDAAVGLGLVGLAALVALGAAFDGPGAAAREALRPEAADAAGSTRERVNAGGEVVLQAGEVGGPVLAGAGLAALGVWGSLWAAAGLFLLAALTTALTLPRHAPRPRTGESYLAATTAGLRHVWRDPVLRGVGVVGCLVLLFVAPLVLVLTTHFQAVGRPGGLGVTLAAFAVGGVAGAVAYGAAGSRARRRPVLLAGMGLASAGLLGLAALPGSLVLLAVVAGLVGLAYGPAPPVLAVVVQDRAPEALRGRVVSTLTSAGLVAAPAATFGAGLLLDATSPRVALVVVAVGCLGATAVAAALPGLRRLERHELEETAP